MFPGMRGMQARIGVLLLSKRLQGMHEKEAPGMAGQDGTREGPRYATPAYREVF
jgi:hypothetical protein